MNSKSQRTLYSENEAASILGLSVEQLRVLVKAHILKNDDAPQQSVPAFQPSDLLLLKFLTANSASTLQ
jgi:hypothetical protein